MSDGLRVTYRRKDALLRKLRKMAPRVDNALRKAIVISAQDVVVTAQNFVPQESGKLKNGIIYLIKNAGFSAVVGVFDPKLFYAIHVELGTSKTPPNPFLFPAFRLNRRKIRGRITRAINTSMKQVIA